MIQAIHKNVEIEMEVHHYPHGYWTCDYTLTRHRGGNSTMQPGNKEFPTEDLARKHALQQARDAIDRDEQKEKRGPMTSAVTRANSRMLGVSAAQYV
jgi:hypothetical protein